MTNIDEYPTLSKSLAVVILTKNEERNIEKCLKGVPLGIYTLVVDSGSTDNTVNIAFSRGCDVITRPWAGFADQRNIALEYIRNRKRWALFIDADEIYTAEIFRWIEVFIDKNECIDAVQISQRIRMDGRVLKYAPGYPIYHPRLVRTNSPIYIKNASGHGESVNINAKVKFLDIPFYHDSIPSDLRPWLIKHIELAKQEATFKPNENVYQTKRSRTNLLFRTGIIRAWLRFFYHYVIRMGFMDGKQGLKYAQMYFWYEITKILLKDSEIRK